jgi:hypothetical protein
MRWGEVWWGLARRVEVWWGLDTTEVRYSVIAAGRWLGSVSSVLLDAEPFLLEDEMRRIEYRLSERRLLKPGTRFTASDGPIFRLRDGTTVPLKAPGPYEFVAYVQTDGYDFIEAKDRNGCSAVLHLSGDRPTASPEIIGRPYRLRKVLRTKQRRRS